MFSIRIKTDLTDQVNWFRKSKFPPLFSTIFTIDVFTDEGRNLGGRGRELVVFVPTSKKAELWNEKEKGRRRKKRIRRKNFLLCVSNLILTITSHPHLKALLQAAILTAIPVMFGHLAIFVSSALVAELFADGPFEEPFAAFTANCTVMATWKEKKKSGES